MGSYYFNCKGEIDADNEFTYIDIDYYRKIRDKGVYRKAFSTLGNNSLNIPKDRNVDDFMILSLVIVSDDNSPMKPFLMKLYSKNNLSIG